MAIQHFDGLRGGWISDDALNCTAKKPVWIVDFVGDNLPTRQRAVIDSVSEVARFVASRTQLKTLYVTLLVVKNLPLIWELRRDGTYKFIQNVAEMYDPDSFEHELVRQMLINKNNKGSTASMLIKRVIKNPKFDLSDDEELEQAKTYLGSLLKEWRTNPKHRTRPPFLDYNQVERGKKGEFSGYTYALPRCLKNEYAEWKFEQPEHRPHVVKSLDEIVAHVVAQGLIHGIGARSEATLEDFMNACWATDENGVPLRDPKAYGYKVPTRIEFALEFPGDPKGYLLGGKIEGFDLGNLRQNLRMGLSATFPGIPAREVQIPAVPEHLLRDKE